MAKAQNISEIHPTLGVTEFDILEKYRKSFNERELGKLHPVFPFERMAESAGLSEQLLGRRSIFSPSAKIVLMVLKSYTGFSTLSKILCKWEQDSVISFFLYLDFPIDGWWNISTETYITRCSAES